MTDEEAIQLWRDAMEYWGRSEPVPEELQAQYRLIPDDQRDRVSRLLEEELGL